MLTQDEWFAAVCMSYAAPPVRVEGRELPRFPDDTVQRNTTGQAGVETLREAFVFYQDCVATFEALGSPLREEHNLLDFGAGWGRIARFFLRELPLQQVHGLDVVQEFVDICRETFRSENFRLTHPFPPTDMTAGSFNFIVGYSVFSHLSEQACSDWMKEFHRILAPGGIVAVTTRGRPFFDYCQSLAGQGNTGYLGALASMFDDFNSARARYDDGEFVHSNREGVNGGGVMTSAYYGETFIPEKYARHAYAEHFVLERFLFEPPRQTHPILFFRKR